ncbi:hypothetical protein P175DRAFT_0529745 [Aspergillus ochraceoroseus IBT 24754]|uniref:Uncharacterized protein n=1 Tax=Aspergillus ochraceoroseus IBT 24754 TaxID=1392256 RepID=A0A2T5M2B9_9EURO|nr:uncharacterized protein P175DRAFT_0529745 [Aspergillus ochraceoroseus IBT 24754]PTU22669.1 hypothetical protein P175DRAFT_0529745 [Aspergillus ochraceoroseus IBT 24754]
MDFGIVRLDMPCRVLGIPVYVVTGIALSMAAGNWSTSPNSLDELAPGNGSRACGVQPMKTPSSTAWALPSTRHQLHLKDFW